MISSFFLLDFLDKYFFSGYTIYNTIIYIIILLICLELILRLFNKININPQDLIFSLVPFIIFGSGIRALVDNNILQYNYFLITPGIYFLVGLIAIISLLVSYFLKNRINFKKTIFLIGIPFAIYPLIYFNHFNFEAFSIILIIWILLSIIFLLISKFWELFRDKINLSIISAHLLDATTTFIGVDVFNYTEQHVLPGGIYNIFDTAITMYPLKIVAISGCLYLIDKHIDDDNLAGLLKLVLFVLGLAPGLRNLLTITIGT